MNHAPTINPTECIKITAALKEPYRLIFEISCLTGLRISDILTITGNQIDIPMIIKESKTKKEKICHLPTSVINRLWGQCYNIEGYVFSSNRDRTKHIHRTTVYKALRKTGERIGIKITPHTGRKFYAQEIYRLTGDMEQVQMALNHKYITTTATYLDINLMELLRSYKLPL